MLFPPGKESLSTVHYSLSRFTSTWETENISINPAWILMKGKTQPEEFALKG
jgi:hypothetical protein